MLLRAITLTLVLAMPAAAQIHYDPYDANGETTGISGPWKRYQTHVVKLSKHRYAVLFRPGYVDAATAIRAVSPLCAAMGRVARGTGDVAPVDLVLEDGEDSVHQGYRVDCAKVE